MEPLYDNLLEYYDDIFPLEHARIDFISNLVHSGDGNSIDLDVVPKILDVGCATGSTALALMRHGMDVTGVDLNCAMVQSACRRNPEPKTNARFFCMDMMEISKAFVDDSFDAILCLGNTLAHLDGPASIGKFLKTTAALLKPQGKTVLQLVNYQKVLDEGLTELPTIETPRARFIRRYEKTDDGHIFFDTTILSSSEQAVYHDRTSLYPLTENELSDLTAESGYKTIQYYGDFSGKGLSQESLGLVAVLSL